MAGGAADDEAGFDDAFFGMVGGQSALDEADEDVGGLFTHLGATLLDCCQHRIADGGAETIGETTNAHIVRNVET